MQPLTLPATGAVRVRINVAVAKITVTERAGAVGLQITGEKDPDQVTVDSSTDPDGTVRITVSERRRRSGAWKRRKGLAIELATPPETALVVDGAAADIANEGVLDSVRFTTAAGDAQLDRISGDLDVKGAAGDVRAASVAGQLSVHLASGDISVGSVDGGANLRTASGKISVGRLNGDSSVSSISGDVDIASVGAGSLAVHVLSGDVTVGLASGVASALDVSTLSGKTLSDLPVSGTPTQPDAPHLDLKVSTVSGDVRVRRAVRPAA
jgi:DUF4097 and DUF4098 domain-containing protein YvlB